MLSPVVREAAVAGLFYPADPEVLRATVDRLLADAPSPPEDAPVPRAVIVPHAGYAYSGSTAAVAYARVARGRHLIRRVVVIGPTHRVPVRGVALPGADGFRTPLGVLAVAQDWAVERLVDVPAACVFAETHRQEHSVEVQLPFLQRVLADVEIVPLLAGDASGEEVADVLDALWGGPETLVVVSSDLSHYLGYEEARRVDAETIEHDRGSRRAAGPRAGVRRDCGQRPDRCCPPPWAASDVARRVQLRGHGRGPIAGRRLLRLRVRRGRHDDGSSLRGAGATSAVWCPTTPVTCCSRPPAPQSRRLLRVATFPPGGRLRPGLSGRARPSSPLRRAVSSAVARGRSPPGGRSWRMCERTR